MVEEILTVPKLKNHRVRCETHHYPQLPQVS